MKEKLILIGIIAFGYYRYVNRPTYEDKYKQYDGNRDICGYNGKFDVKTGSCICDKNYSGSRCNIYNKPVDATYGVCKIDVEGKSSNTFTCKFGQNIKDKSGKLITSCPSSNIYNGKIYTCEFDNGLNNNPISGGINSGDYLNEKIISK